MLDIAALMKTAALGDGRLNKRALTLVTGIIEGQASATHGPEGVGHQRPWSHAMGAFRFFDNDRLRLPALYEPCRSALRELVAPGQRCYVMHDVSVVDYSGHQGKEDLIPVGNDKGYGYELFSSFVVSDQGGELYSGHLFVFRGRRADRIKILGWDRGGFVLYYKRLEKGRFRWPQLTPQAKEVVLDSTQLAMLLDGIDVQRVRRPAGWEPKQTGASGQTPLGG